MILPREVWVASGHVEAFVDPLVECQSCHKRFRADQLEEAVRGQARPPGRRRAGRDRVPELRHPRRLDRAADVQRPAQDLPRPGGVRRGPALPAPGDRAGHLRQLPQRRCTAARRSRRSASRRSASRSATRSRRATSSSVPASSSRWRWSSSSSRATDEEWHEYWLAGALELVRRPGHPAGEPALLRAPEGEALALLEAHGRHRVPLPVRRPGVLRAGGHRQPHRLRPAARTPSTPAPTCPTSTRRGTSATSRTSSSPRPA